MLQVLWRKYFVVLIVVLFLFFPVQWDSDSNFNLTLYDVQYQCSYQSLLHCTLGLSHALFMGYSETWGIVYITVINYFLWYFRSIAYVHNVKFSTELVLVHTQTQAFPSTAFPFVVISSLVWLPEAHGNFCLLNLLPLFNSPNFFFQLQAKYYFLRQHSLTPNTKFTSNFFA